ncbi:MAG: hypothetical protein ACFCGT_00555 [Sandaracinaceae bacterium]
MGLTPRTSRATSGCNPCRAWGTLQPQEILWTRAGVEMADPRTAFDLAEVAGAAEYLFTSNAVHDVELSVCAVEIGEDARELLRACPIWCDHAVACLGPAGSAQRRAECLSRCAYAVAHEPDDCVRAFLEHVVCQRGQTCEQLRGAAASGCLETTLDRFAACRWRYDCAGEAECALIFGFESFERALYGGGSR